MSDGEDGKDLKAIFSKHYRGGMWKGGYPETVCGKGSTLNATQYVRRELPNLISILGVRSIFDAPCGDFTWFQHLELPGVVYIGGDIVEDMISANNKAYGAPSRKFIVCDVTTSALPPSDLMICRDLIQHLPNKAIDAFFENFLKSDIKYLAITNHTKPKNVEQSTAIRFRSVNLNIEPYNFEDAAINLRDWVEGVNSERYLSVWKHSEIAAFWKRRRAYSDAVPDGNE